MRAFLENERLIIDEVLAVGDAEFQKKCLGKMEDISKSGRTILFVSHNLTSVQELCPKSILLQKGKVEMIKDTDAVISAYTIQNNKGISVDLAKRKSKAVFLSDFEIYRDAGENGQVIYPDQCCNFKVSVESKIKVDGIHIGIGINDKMNVRLFTLFTKHQGLNYTLNPGLNSISCKIDNLPLKSDIYQIHVFIGTDFELYDYSNDEINLEVSPANFFYKETPDSSQGSIIVKQQWKREQV